jgi:hypothetical protein
LKYAPFRPDFAKDATTKAGIRYETTLNSIEKDWNVDSLDPMGSI